MGTLNHPKPSAGLAACVLVMTVFGTASISNHAVAADRYGERLVGRLTGKSNAVRMQALEEIQRTAHTKYRALPYLSEAVQELAQQVEPDEIVPVYTVAMIFLIGSIDRPEAETALTQLLESPHVGIVMTAVDSLGKNQHHGAIDAIARLKDHPDFDTNYGLRFSLARALADMKHPDAIELLTSWRATWDGQLRHEVDKLLSKLELIDFANDEKRYQAWKESMSQVETAASRPEENANDIFDEPNKIQLRPASYEEESLQRLKLGNQSRQYYGIDINAKRMLFIIDHSGSMKEYWGGVTRLDRAKQELTRVIDGLDDNAEFAIIFYETAVRQWNDRLVQATPENKSDATKFIQRLQYGNRTNTYGALLDAINFSDQLETVFLLTDGRPTEGALVAPQAIVQDILHRNRFRHLNFNTIGVAVGGATEAFLKTLAEQSGGEFRAAQ